MTTVMGFEKTHIFTKHHKNRVRKIRNYLKKTKHDNWCVDIYRTKCQTKHCVLSHIAEGFGTLEMEWFEGVIGNSYTIGHGVNDKPSADYPQTTPKGRCCKYLSDIIKNKRRTIWGNFIVCGERRFAGVNSPSVM